jgi:hypothetical protein
MYYLIYLKTDSQVGMASSRVLDCSSCKMHVEYAFLQVYAV